MLAHRLLCRLHAALRAGPDGHDPPHAALRQSRMAAWLVAAAVGVVIILAGIACQIIQLVVSIRAREQRRDRHRRSLERPHAGMVDGVAATGLELRRSARSLRARCVLEQQATPRAQQRSTTSTQYQPIEMPKNSAIGFVTAFFAVVIGFALIWHIWWMAVLGLVGTFVSVLVFAFRDVEEIEISAEQIIQYRKPSADGDRVMNSAVVIDEAGRTIAPDVGGAGPAPKRIVVAYGFWIFLLSDVVMFSALFAAYAVLVRATADGPTGEQLFSQVSVAIETACLLASSYTCGLMSLAVNSRRHGAIYLFAAITFVLGAAFLTLEILEFAAMIARGATPQRSAFLSAFFTLVGCHGLHVTAGLVWLVVMMAQVAIKGFRPNVGRRLLLLCPVLAHTRHRLGLAVHGRLSDGSLVHERHAVDRAPGDNPATAGTGKQNAVRRGDLHDWTGSCRGPHGDVVLGGQHVAALGARHAAGACGARDSPDGRASRVLSAHHDGAGKHQQCPGARTRHPHRVPGGCRLDFHHGEPE